MVLRGRREQCLAPSVLAGEAELSEPEKVIPNAHGPRGEELESCCLLGDGEELFPQGHAPCVSSLAQRKMPTAQTALGRPGAAPPPADTAPARGCRSVPLRGQHTPLVAINDAPRVSWRVSSWWARSGVSGRVLSNSRAVVRWLIASALRRLLRRLLSRQAEILHGLLRYCHCDCSDAPGRCSGRPTGAWYSCFDRLRRVLVQGFAPLLQHRAVGHFLRQRMLEDVLDFGKRGLFVEKLFALEGGEQAIQFVFRLGDDLADQAQRELPANDRELLQQGFLVWGEAIDAGGEDALHGGGNM